MPTLETQIDSDIRTLSRSPTIVQMAANETAKLTLACTFAAAEIKEQFGDVDGSDVLMVMYGVGLALHYCKNTLTMTLNNADETLMNMALNAGRRTLKARQQENLEVGVVARDGASINNRYPFRS